MDKQQRLRLDGLRLYNLSARTPKHLRYRQRVWGDTAATIVPALDTDRVVEVSDRVDQVGGEATVVVYYPDRHSIDLVTCRSGRIVEGDEPIDIHDESNMAMLLELVKAEHKVVTTTSADITAAAAR
jgi:hypothetical protein